MAYRHRRHQHHNEHHNALPAPPAPMDEAEAEEADDVFGDDVLGPLHQPSQVSQGAGDDFDRNMIYDGRPFVAALLFLAGRLAALPEWEKVASGNFFIKRDQGRLAMAFLRYLAQTRALNKIELVLNSLYHLAPEPIVRFVTKPVPAGHLLVALPLRTKQDDPFLGRPRPYGAGGGGVEAGKALVKEVVKRGWDRDLAISKHRMTLGFSHRPAVREEQGEGRTTAFPLFLPGTAGKEERVLSWDTLVDFVDAGLEGKPDFDALLRLARGQQHDPAAGDDSDAEAEAEANDARDDGNKAAAEEEGPADEGKEEDKKAAATPQPTRGGGGRRRTRAATTAAAAAAVAEAAAAPSSPFPAYPPPLEQAPDWAADASSSDDDDEEGEEGEVEDDEEEGDDASVASPLPPKKRHRAAASAAASADGDCKSKKKKKPRVVLVPRSPPTPTPAPAPAPVAAPAPAAAATGKGKKGKAGGSKLKGKGATAAAGTAGGPTADGRSGGTSTAFIQSLMTPALYQALWRHLSKDNRSENTVTTYLCGIRVFLDQPGVVPLPAPKLASTGAVKTYLVTNGQGFFSQWAKRGFKTISAVNQIVEFAGLYMKHHKAAGAGEGEKVCLYSDEKKSAEHLVASFPLAPPTTATKPATALTPSGSKKKKGQAQQQQAAATPPTPNSTATTTTTAAAPALSQQQPAAANNNNNTTTTTTSTTITKKRGRPRGRKGTATAAAEEAEGMKRLQALAFAASMAAALPPPPKPRKLARGLGPYAESDYSSSASWSSSEEEGMEGVDDEGLWWGNGGGWDEEKVVVMLKQAATAGGGSPKTPLGVCKPEEGEECGGVRMEF